MFYVLVHFPDIDTVKIDRFRKKYDPTFELIEAHITIIFPVPASIGEKNLTEHIEKKLEGWSEFDIHLSGFEKSWDNWLFLVLREGRDQVIRLYDDLYQGILEPYLRKDIQFIPHLALGLFVKHKADYQYEAPSQLPFDEEAYSSARQEAESMELDYICVFNKLHLLEINDDFTSISLIREFELEGIGG
jgi:2'-5' RNA ligase